MDPLTAASAFATIVQLLAIFRQEEGTGAALNHEKFIEWLEQHRHEEIKNLICNTAAIQGEVDKLLCRDHAVMLEKLDSINTVLATLLSRVGEFRGLAVMMVPSSEFSEQALSILRQLVESGSSYFCRIKYLRGYSLQLEGGGQIQHDEPRFLDDDLGKLVSLGLVILDYTQSGREVYRITREAMRMLGAADERSPRGA